MLTSRRWWASRPSLRTPPTNTGVSRASAKALADDGKLMRVEGYVSIGERKVMSDPLRPLINQLALAFREW